MTFSIFNFLRSYNLLSLLILFTYMLICFGFFVHLCTLLFHITWLHVKRIFRLHKFADLSDKKPCLISFYNLVLHPSETYESECNSAFHIQKEKLALNKGLNHAITPLDDMSALDKGLNHAITFSNGTCAPNKGLNHATRLPDGILSQNLGLNHAFTLFDDKSIQNNDLDPTIILPKHFCAPRKGLNYATKPPNGIHAPSKDVTLGSRPLNDILSNILKEDVYCVIGLLNDILPLKSEVNHIIKLLNHFISILRMGTNTMLHITNKVMINFGKCLVLSMIQFTKPYNHVSFLNQFVSPTINHPVGGGKSVIVPYLIMSISLLRHQLTLQIKNQSMYKFHYQN